MAKFNVGDKVKVVAVISKYQGWIDEYNVQFMEKHYLQEGVVIDLYNELDHGYQGCFVDFTGGNKWSYPNPALKKIKQSKIPCEV